MTARSGRRPSEQSACGHGVPDAKRQLPFTVLAACAVAVASLTATALGQRPTTQPIPAPTPPTPADAFPASAGDDLTSLSLEDLMNVEVTSVSRKKQSIFAAPAAVSVITQDDMRRSGFSTIPDMLRMAPGVHVGRINSYAWAVGVRGLNSQFNDNLLVLQDGRSLYTPLYGGVFWDTVDYVIPDLERIEVIRGPGATLWGANAVNGVINITTKDARDTQGWLLDTRASNDNTDVSVRYGGKLDEQTYYRVYLKEKYNNEFDDVGDEWNALLGGFRIDRHFASGDSFTIQGDVANNRINEPYDLPVYQPPYSERVHHDRNDTTANVLARWTHHVSDDSDWTLQTYYDYLRVDFPEIHYEQHTLDLDFHHSFKTSVRNEVTWGLGTRVVHSNMQDTEIIQATPSSRTDAVYSAFVQDTFALVPDKWFLTVGSKFEHNDYTGFEVQPSARLMWTPNKQNTVWAAVSRAVRTPTRLASDVNVNVQTVPIPAGDTTATGVVQLQNDSDPESQVLTAYEIGYRVEPIAGFSVDTALFYDNYDHLQSYTPQQLQFGSPIIIPIAQGNDASGSVWGGEVSTTIRLTDAWRISASYALLECVVKNQTTADGGGSDILNLNGSSSPQHQAQLRSYWDITKNLELNAGIYYIGEVEAYDIPSYISSNVNLVWRPKEQMQLAVGVLNIFDDHHPEFDATGNQGVGTEIPRTFFIQFTYQF